MVLNSFWKKYTKKLILKPRAVAMLKRKRERERERKHNWMESTGEEECGVCATAIANHGYAYTACRHLFCISCLLKWHKANPRATCPMCRTPLYEDEADPAATETDRILEALDFNMEEEIMHDHMMELATAHARVVNLCIIPNEDGSNHMYERIDVGSTTPNSHYIVEVFDAARAFRFRFGRIENIISHHLVPDSKWYAFRERVARVDEEHAQIVTEWADEIHHIAIDNVIMLIQYCAQM